MTQRRPGPLRWRFAFVAVQVVAAIAVVAFAVWAVSLVISVRELRAEVEQRVRWLSAIQRGQVELDGTPEASRAAAEELRRLAREIKQARASNGDVVAACERTDALLGGLQRDGTDAARKDARGAVDQLVRGIRAETAALSTELGQRWSSLYGLVAVSLLLATSTLAMGVSLHRVRRAHADKAREEEEAKLRHADRLAAIGTLAGAVAHEVNTPLATVLLTLKLIEEQLATVTQEELPLAERREAERDVRGLLASAQSEVEKVAAIVRDLRAFAHQDDGTVELVDVAASLEVALGLVEPTALKGCRIVREIREVPRVRAVPRRLEQVFLNLLLNAAQAMEEQPPEATELRVTIDTSPEGEVRIEISDSGVGIPDDVVARGFEPFVTTKPVGTGLGLFVCAGILKRLGGTLRLSRREGGGTSAVVVLPAGERPRTLGQDRATTER